MKKRAVCCAACLLLLFALCVPALASDGGSWWGNAFSWFPDVANYIKSLFVPPEEYFHNELAELSGLANNRLGGVGELYQLINRFFNDLSSVPAVGLEVSLPRNFLFKGYSGVRFDLFTSAKPYINLLRSVLTTSFCVMIAIACYHHLRTFFTEAE